MSRKSYPVRIPRYAAGIRAQESRTGAGRSWWAKEWARRLEAMGLRGRLGRGKNYAVSGQVVSMEISGNRVLAQVQGTRPEPYAVTVTFRQPEGETRSRIVAALRGEPMLVARLLADDLPTEVEKIFREPVLYSVDPETWKRVPCDKSLNENALYHYNLGSVKYRMKL